MPKRFKNLAAWYVVLAATIPVLVDAAPRQTLSRHVPSAARPGNYVGHLPATNQIRLVFGLPLRNQAGLTAFLGELYNPASPNFRKYLNNEEFTERYGPAKEDYQQVVAFLKNAGFTKIHTSANRMIVSAIGDVRDIESVLHLKLELHKHPKENRNFFAPDREPTLDLATPILHISGLDNFTLPRPASLKPEPLDPGASLPDQAAKPMAGSGPSGRFMGADFRRAYAPGVSLNGSNQFVGLVQFDGYNTSAIRTYETLAGLPNVPLINVLLDNINGLAGSNNIEVALDIEMAISMAPGLAAVIVYEGQAPNDILNRMATDNAASQLSASWSFTIDSTTDQIYQQFAAQGQSYFNASGDDAAYASSPSTPTDHPWITSVGGTSLGMSGAGLVWVAETTWNQNDGTTGSGGGISTTYPIPDWQKAVDMSTNGGSTSMRNIPDVSMVAANVFVVYNTGTQATVVGTSIASPLWAAFTALVNQKAASLGLPPVGFINPAIYSIASGTNYGSAFHDIKTGNNTNNSSPMLFFAMPGYDLCTGWGTPTGSNLINQLVVAPPATILTNGTAILAAETCGPVNGVIDAGEIVTVNFSLVNIGSIPSTNLVATLLPGNGIDLPSLPQTYGVVAGNGGIVTKSFTFTATTNCGSLINPTLSLQDGDTNFGTVTFSMPTGTPILPLSQNFDGVTAPALPAGWTASRSGSVSNWISSSSNRFLTGNAAYVAEATNPGIAELTSPVFTVSNATAQVQFRHFLNTEIFPDNKTMCYDGGVLEIKIGANGFTDIIDSGGSFVTGGYTCTIDPTDDNPLDGRSCWSGLSAGFITTLVNLPANAVGNSIQLKWRFGTDSFNGYGNGGGWFIDNVQVIDGYTCCTGSPPTITTLQPTNQSVAMGSNATFTVSAGGNVPLGYQWSFGTSNLPGATAAALLLTNVQPSQSGNYYVLVTNALGSITSGPAALRVLVPPTLRISRAGITPTNVSITLTSVAGLNYSLAFKNALTDATWVPISAIIIGTGGPITLTDTNVPLPASRFYRVQSF